MKTYFADTYYFLAMLNVADAHRNQVEAFNVIASPLLVTTAWVLTEVADALAAPRHRALFGELMRAVEEQPGIRVVPAGPALFEAGTRLYLARPDKEWSLTDCISFVVMKDERITQALTGDRHFDQAGFRAQFL